MEAPMPTTIDDLRPHLQNFDFERLFIEGLGWDHFQSSPLDVAVDKAVYSLQPAAEKAGFAVFVCGPDQDGAVPPYPIRRKIESQVTKRNYEHLIIFIDEKRTQQIWQWVKRETGRSPACREHTLYAGQSGTPLLQRINSFLFTLEDEARGVGVGEVSAAVSKGMDVEKITKQFYERFRTELTAFRNFIEGITDMGDRDWYASLMLNRMMFIYFIQKQGFLDDDLDYLGNRLARLRETGTKGRFQDFYRAFLRRLFHEGLGQPEDQRDSELNELLGRVPFLNGGLFDVHVLERDYPDIEIPDEAFERVFEFFDGYRWHLDERPHREDNEINPDVLGYIFEKYINQKQMGAYYTKEDITGYISRNTVIPFLFDEAKKKCPVAFEPHGGVWGLLRDDPDRYIYPAMAHGLTWNARIPHLAKQIDAPYDLPPAIAAGINDVSRRDGWNEPATDDFGLLTETWREVVARRQRHAEVRGKLEAGEVTEISDLITLNLDIERFAIDVIVQSEGPELLRAFWQALYGKPDRSETGISVLDPTCGSGAFLFAALNNLEPLYTACLEGMQGFRDDLDRTERPHSPAALNDFGSVLEQVAEHPNERYFILKSIVLNNLYGVDIMEEAVEICKLRLFLKLVAQLENYDEIEPLPDIDFNIRAGNTLVGFASLDAVRDALAVGPDGQRRALFEQELVMLGLIEEEADIVGRAFARFREQQTKLGGDIAPGDKQVLRDRLRILTQELDHYLALQYGSVPWHTDILDAEAFNTTAFRVWASSHKPFHWFVEFYGVIENGGFDVVIGNPPYVEYKEVKDEYRVLGYATEPCKNLYAFTWERSLHLAKDGHLGMIVPASAVSTDRYKPLRHLLHASGRMVVSSYGDNPGKLFDGMPHNRLQIVLIQKGDKSSNAVSSGYYKWRPDAREHLFQSLRFIESADLMTDAGLAKIGHEVEASLLRKINTTPLVPQHSRTSSTQYAVYFTRKLSHFVQILDFIPTIYDADGNLREPSELKRTYFPSELIRDAALGILNSSIFYWLVTVFSDCRNLNQREVQMIRFDVADTPRLQQLAVAARDLMEDVRSKSELKKQGTLTIQQTFPRHSKPFIDKIDRILGEHYGLTDEECDFIINHDIKYRMGL